MSITLTLSGNESILVGDYFPPIDLKRNYVCGLVDFHTYNSIPNIDVDNNLFHIGKHIIEIPVGAYELDDIADYIQEEYNRLEPAENLKIFANRNTLQAVVKSSKDIIYFNRDRSIGLLLGFSAIELKPGNQHSSDLPLNITNISAIHLECNIVNGSYINNEPAHIIHMFAVNVSSGYKIDEIPKNVIYLPVNTKQISSVTVKVVDQSGKLINFCGETITLRLHLKPLD